MRSSRYGVVVGVFLLACAEPRHSSDSSSGWGEVMTGAVAPAPSLDAVGAAAAAGASGASSVGSGGSTTEGVVPVELGATATEAPVVAAGGTDAGVLAPEPARVGHPKQFIASIHGGGADQLVFVDVDNPQRNWALDVSDGIQDFQLIGNNKLLVGYKFNFGYMEVDLATHRIDVQVRDFLERSEAILTSVRRLENGHTLIMAQGLRNVAAGAAGNLEVWEVDNDKKIYEMRTFSGCCGNLRVVRLTDDGHFLVGGDSALVELDQNGAEIMRRASGGSPTYMGLKTADGTYYATNGHGGQLVSWAPGGQRTVIGGRNSASSGDVAIYQPGQFQILQNGNIVITNWTAENGGMGQQLVEYDPGGNLVWSWDDPAVRPQGMETLLVLDNLDPAVLNDDRDGVLQPRR